MNLCKVKQLLNVTDDASGLAGAIAGISAVIKSAAPSSPYIGAIAGLLWLSRYAIKKISANGTYGVKYEIWGVSPTAFVMYPWRQ
ncbi:hypothetical protein BCI9360_00377 [Bacillus sp. CECT 9360]|nr:hypothetical protein BCI9360_00377 [Bacillus sp. CECT 9360]